MPYVKPYCTSLPPGARLHLCMGEEAVQAWIRCHRGPQLQQPGNPTEIHNILRRPGLQKQKWLCCEGGI